MRPKRETERCLSAELCSRCRGEGQGEAAGGAHAKRAQTPGRCHTQGEGGGGIQSYSCLLKQVWMRVGWLMDRSPGRTVAVFCEKGLLVDFCLLLTTSSFIEGGGTYG